MIPYAIFGAELNTGSGMLDLCAAEISVEGFTFRVLRDHPEEQILQAEKLRLRFSEPGKTDRWLEFSPEPGKTDQWLEFSPEPGKTDSDCGTVFAQNPDNLSEERRDAGTFDVTVDESEENDDLAEVVCRYRIRIDDPDYRREVNRLMAAWSGYVRGKAAGDDAELAKKMTGYPAEMEQVFPLNRAEQRQRQMEDIRKRMSGVSGGKLTSDGKREELISDGNREELISDRQREELISDGKHEELILDGSGENFLPDKLWRRALGRFPEIGLSLDRPDLFRRYLDLSQEEFFRQYWEELGLLRHPLTGLLQEKGRIHVIGIGNPGCIRLFPDPEEMMRLLERVKGNGCIPLIQFPPLREMELERGEKIFRAVIRWSEKEKWPVEIMVNDWGMLRIAAGLRDVAGGKSLEELRHTAGGSRSAGETSRQNDQSVNRKIILGSALVKYRRDVRLPWMHWSDEQLAELGDCPGMPDFYVRWLQEEKRVDGMLWESAGYDMQLPGKQSRGSGLPVSGMSEDTDHEKIKMFHILQLPYYTMNLSGNCTLYAACRNGDRGCQMPVTDCPEYCKERAFLYPDFLGMTGRYNGLFGMDSRILEQPDVLEHWADQGVTCLMWNIR